MAKYSTKYFGDFEAGETDTEIIIDSKINLSGKIKDISILMFNVNTYFHKINTCVKMLNKYPKLYKIGKKEIMDLFGNPVGFLTVPAVSRPTGYETRIYKRLLFRNWSFRTTLIKNYEKNGAVRKFFDECLVKLIEEKTEEKIIGINVNIIMEKMGPPSIVFNNNNGEIILALGYKIIDKLDEVIIIEINEKYKIKGIKYYK